MIPRNASAFPSLRVYTGGEGEVCSDSIEGMTLRQWYIGQALAGFCASSLAPSLPSLLAERARQVADAIIDQLDAEV